MEKLLFVRIGWMKFYAGSTLDDPRPIGGGSYNRRGIGHERYNFSDSEGNVYGFFRLPTKDARLNLARLAPGAKETIVGALVVFVANGVVVGWYRDARVHDEAIYGNDAVRRRRENIKYYAEAKTKNAVLVPTAARLCLVPRGKGGMGQSNVCYSLDKTGQPKTSKWIRDVRAWIDSYEGPNLLIDRFEEAAPDIADAVDKTDAASAGVPYCSDAGARKAVELRAVKIAREYFEAGGYAVEEKGKPYDLRCTRDSDTLHVEVKGSQGPATTVILTPNEVSFSTQKREHMALLVVSSISLSKKADEYRASGGVARLFFPWSPAEESLKPIAYTYTVPEGGLPVEFAD